MPLLLACKGQYHGTHARHPVPTHKSRIRPLLTQQRLELIHLDCTAAVAVVLRKRLCGVCRHGSRHGGCDVRLTCGRRRRRQEGGGRRRWGRRQRAGSRTDPCGPANPLRCKSSGRGLAGGGLGPSRAPGWLRVTTGYRGCSGLRTSGSMRDHLRPPPWTCSWLVSGLQLLATHLCSLRTAPAMLLGCLQCR